MSARIIAVANMKGGVGKTATVVSLAEALAASGYRVLVIDLDAQANASICLAGDKLLAELMRDKLTIEGLLHDQLIGRKTLTVQDCIRTNVSNVSHLREQLAISLLPSSPELRNFEMRIVHTLTRARQDWEEIVRNLSAVVKLQLSKTKGHHDFILIDCAPGISALTEVSVRLADLVIVPTIADFLSTFGLQNFCITLAHCGLSDNIRKPKRLPHVLITRRKQVRHQHEMVEILRNERTTKHPTFDIFRTEIPETVKVAEALSLIRTYPSFSEKWSAVAGVLSELADEIRKVLDVDRA